MVSDEGGGAGVPWAPHNGFEHPLAPSHDEPGGVPPSRERWLLQMVYLLYLISKIVYVGSIRGLV